MMRFLYHPYLKKLSGYALLLLWIFVLGIKTLHSHNPHPSVSSCISHGSETPLFVPEKEHHTHCSICEYQTVGDTGISFPQDLASAVAPNNIFLPYEENNLLTLRRALTTDRGPPAQTGQHL